MDGWCWQPPPKVLAMAKITRMVFLAVATILLLGAVVLAARREISWAVGLLALAMLAEYFERMLAIETGGGQ